MKYAFTAALLWAFATTTIAVGQPDANKGKALEATKNTVAGPAASSFKTNEGVGSQVIFSVGNALDQPKYFVATVVNTGDYDLVIVNFNGFNNPPRSTVIEPGQSGSFGASTNRGLDGFRVEAQPRPNMIKQLGQPDPDAMFMWRVDVTPR